MKRLALASFAFLAACGGPRTTVRYEPLSAPSTRLPGGLPSLYVHDVKDRTNGGRLNGTMGIFPQDPGTRWSEVLREALLVELDRIGWPVVQNPGLAGAALRAAAARTEATWGSGFNVRVDGKLVVELGLEDMSGKPLWEGSVQGSGSGVAGGGGVPENGIRMAWRSALEDAMGRLGPLLAAEKPWTRQSVKATAPAVAAAALEPSAAPAPVKSDIDQLPAARPESARRHAIVIGVERYRENLPRADFASGDARLAAEYFKRVLGVPEANLALLVDERASKSDFEKYFERWLPNRVEAGDEVFVYFSGHGSPNPKSGDAYLVPFDGDPTYIAETGYPIKKLYDQLAKLPAKRVFVAMDSCFSGAGGRSVLAKGARPLVSVQTADVTGNVTVLSASAGDQISSSYQEKGHGLFTYFLLKGLKDKNGDFKAAFDYLKPEVARIARREYNADQDPQWRGSK